jgi:hypothetical protein
VVGADNQGPAFLECDNSPQPVVVNSGGEDRPFMICW